jgi:hypothetical protein
MEREDQGRRLGGENKIGIVKKKAGTGFSRATLSNRTTWGQISYLQQHYSVELSLMTEVKSACQRDTSTPMYIAALFTIVKIWNQLKCPSTDEWARKIWYLQVMEHYSTIRRDEILSFMAT